MFDIAPTELALVAVVALVVIGPKDLPRVMRAVGQWTGKARAMARHFRSGMDEMIRQSELEEMEKKWREENERIMRAYPTTEPTPAEAEALSAEPAPLPPPLPSDAPAPSPPASAPETPAEPRP